MLGVADQSDGEHSQVARSSQTMCRVAGGKICVDVADPATASDSALGCVHAITDAIARETGAEEPLEPLEGMIARVRDAASAARASRYWIAREDEVPVGCGAFFWSHSAPQHRIAGFGVDVVPGARRRGVGTRLLAEVLDAAGIERKTTVQTWTVTGGLGEPFLTAFDGHLGSVARLMDLDISSVDHSLLEDWVLRAPERASGYSLVEWTGSCPPELLDEWVRVMAVMNTAPTDDLIVEERPRTVAEVADDEESARRRGWEGRCVAARENATGNLVGYSAIGISPDSDVARQGDTVVEPPHRRRGIGRWLKAAMLLRLLDERPDIRRIRSDNAASNAPMLAINQALGFRTVRSNGIWQLDVKRAREIARTRLSGSEDRV